MEIEEANTEAYKKAIDALSKYKFLMFGYHAAQWVLLNNLGGGRPQPLQALRKISPVNERSSMLPRQIELLHRSSQRMMAFLKIERTPLWWQAMRREAWIHLKRSISVWWSVIRKKESE